MSRVGHPLRRTAPQDAPWAADLAGGRAGSRHVCQGVIRTLQSIFLAIGGPRQVRAIDLFPGFDDKQLRDIGLRVDQVISIDALCQENLHASCEASAEQLAERRTRIAAETTWPTAPADRIAISRWGNTS